MISFTSAWSRSACVCCAVLFAAHARLLAQDSPLPRHHAPQPTTAAITKADAMTRLYIIADDSMLGRDAGTISS